MRIGTSRLLIRPFTPDDLSAIYRILDVEIDGAPAAEAGPAWEARVQWLDWTVRNYDALAALYQPPYGDRAVTLKDSGQLIGAVGLVPMLGPYGQLPGEAAPDDPAARLFTAEVGLFWAISPARQRQGYATEAGRALIDFAFNNLNLRRIAATTNYDNLASQAVMRRLGMRLLRNPLPEPHWFQVVGLLDNAVDSGKGDPHAR